MRLIRSLSGKWQFQVDPEGVLNISSLAPDREITVPLPWQVEFPELERYSGYAWYRTQVDLHEDWLAGELLLHFGAVDYWCQVFVNGQLVGEHEGGYMPITLPVRSAMQTGQNEIAVRVYDPVQTSISIERWPHAVTAKAMPFAPEDIPHGKQEWYINVGGLWQDVTLTAVPAVYIATAHVTTTNAGKVRVDVQVAGATAALEDGALSLAVNGTPVSASVEGQGDGAYTLTFNVDSPNLWTPDTPTLYQLTVTLRTTQGEDEKVIRFGFRELTTRDGQLLLNGEPFYLLSALDQDFYPETIYTVPSEDYLRDQFTKTKELGFNSLRCHIKPPDPIYLDLADEMGLLIWSEIPSWRTFHVKPSLQPEGADVPNAVQARVEQLLREMIARDYNHPSLMIWTIVNEDWGTALALSAADRQWVSQMVALCKQLDPTRLVVDNSACMNAWGPNIHVYSDLEDFHIYGNIPDHADGFAMMAEQIGLRPLWTYSNYGDSTRTGKEPIILSEFGNWGLPSLSSYGGEEPKWFHIGAWWSAFDGIPGWPRGVYARFQRLGLDKIWTDYEAFAAATQWHAFQAIKWEIETLRRQSTIQGYVLTELTDIYWESNGVLDFNRGRKVFHDVFSTVNATDVVMAQPERYAFWDDETVTAQLHGSHYSAQSWAGSQLRWGIGEAQGSAEVPDTSRGSLVDLGSQQWALEPVEQPAQVQAWLSIERDGETLARNTLDLVVLPASARTPDYTQSLGVTPGPLAGTLERLGYATTDWKDAPLVLADKVGADLLAWVRDGGSLLYLSTGPGPFFWHQSRGGTYGGGWINNYSWLRPGVHKRLPDANPLSLPFRQITPEATITGLPVEDAAYHDDFLAGQISGWVQLPAVHTVQFRYGSGKVLMTTFRLAQALATETPSPVAVAMLHDLVDHLASERCQPALKANY
jgi:hypothetical protein